MTKKTIKNTLLAAIVSSVLCAGTVSARQMSLNVQDTTCQHHFCSKTQPCPNVLGCGCVIQPGFTTGVCNFIAAKPGK
jgi:hypothetical protein